MKTLIESVFKETIDNTFPNESIRSFLSNHPMRFVMFDNLQREIQTSGYVLSDLSGDLEKKREAIKSMVKSLTIIFAKTALQVKENELKNNKPGCCGD